jgi:predicted HAD superfamily phosphohydrolase YqeG
VRIPYLPPLSPSIGNQHQVYTLVLDLDETLIHFECEEDNEDGEQ